MKIRILLIAMALMMLSVVAEGAQEYWNGDTNYPKVYSHQGVDFYIDLSSAFISDQHEGNGSSSYLVKYTSIAVEGNGKVHTDLSAVGIVHENGRSIYYRVMKNGEWERNEGEFGYQIEAYEAARLLDRHLF